MAIFTYTSKMFGKKALCWTFTHDLILHIFNNTNQSFSIGTFHWFECLLRDQAHSQLSIKAGLLSNCHVHPIRTQHCFFSPRLLNLAEQRVINNPNKSNHESEQYTGQNPTSHFFFQTVESRLCSLKSKSKKKAQAKWGSIFDLAGCKAIGPQPQRSLDDGEGLRNMV